MRSEEEGTNDRHDRSRAVVEAMPAEVRTVAGGAPLRRPQQGRKNNTGESHHKHVFGFGNESENGTDIYIILTYSRMLSIAISLHRRLEFNMTEIEN